MMYIFLICNKSSIQSLTCFCSGGWENFGGSGGVGAAVQVMKKYKLVSDADKIVKGKNKKKVKSKKGLKGPLAPSILAKAAEDGTLVKATQVKSKKKRKKKNPKGKDGKEAAGTEESPGSNPSEKVEETQMDMSGWNDMFVHPLVLKAIADQGFASPTPIQVWSQIH